MKEWSPKSGFERAGLPRRSQRIALRSGLRSDNSSSSQSRSRSRSSRGSRTRNYQNPYNRRISYVEDGSISRGGRGDGHISVNLNVNITIVSNDTVGRRDRSRYIRRTRPIGAGGIQRRAILGNEVVPIRRPVEGLQTRSSSPQPEWILLALESPLSPTSNCSSDSSCTSSTSSDSN
ncbi:uncharacterized protein LOC115621563 [Scaptodrosophila lebanonensis]|uniref:Uncharacterized protein LOC115621563 n=1 Tax=Drosophila lebanonensis TaxID=7225 RepID=A0A6J2T7K0_DROLE|nr:uncharacterized protein LOC115621563 [Scaptodrosophila lebanonensis]